mmetsp:Transcript_66082/g.184750  ORF Transcript_66082/g.184750 Transcript_66082/m.184750 type:complete len:208 (+) Transcript_66082:197-820(+)
MRAAAPRPRGTQAQRLGSEVTAGGGCGQQRLQQCDGPPHQLEEDRRQGDGGRVLALGAGHHRRHGRARVPHPPAALRDLEQEPHRLPALEGPQGARAGGVGGEVAGRRLGPVVRQWAGSVAAAWAASHQHGVRSCAEVGAVGGVHTWAPSGCEVVRWGWAFARPGCARELSADRTLRRPSRLWWSDRRPPATHVVSQARTPLRMSMS